MRASVRVHLPTVAGRLRAEPGLLVLVGFVVALSTMLVAAVAPLSERTADRAIAATVRDAGPRAAVVATLPREGEDPRGQARDPLSVVEFRQDTDYARFTLPARLKAVVSPGVASLTTPSLQLTDGLGRYLRLAYLESPEGEPAVTYVDGGPPRASVGSDSEPWPVQVALSEAAASDLGLAPGDRVMAEDAQNRPVAIRVSGVFVAQSPDDQVWQTSPELLHPTQGITEGGQRTSATALVSADALPDLRLAVPLDDLTHRVVFNPRPDRMRWHSSAGLAQAVVSLQSSAGLARGRISWDSLLDRVLGDGRVQVAAARGQAQVLLLGLLAAVLLVLALAAQLLVARRSGSLTLARERGAALTDLGAELLVESLLVSVAGAAAGLLTTRLLVGAADWRWALPVLVVAALAGPVLGVLLAARATDLRRTPANRTARRTAIRARKARRYLLEAAVVAIAVLTFVALRQRGVTGGDEGSGDLTAASSPVWWAVAGTLLLLRAFLPLARLLLRRARRSTGVVGFFISARLVAAGPRTLSLLVVAVTVAQLTLGVTLTLTEHRGQEAGALLSVGGDARLSAAPDPAVARVAAEVRAAAGVDEAVAARVEDHVRASARDTAADVTLVVVDSAAYAHLLAASPLPDDPQLARLRESRRAGGAVPALLLGGPAGLRTDLVVRWDEVAVPLTVVGVAPRVEAATDPVVVVDADEFAESGRLAEPDTVWAVGPGAPVAVADAGRDQGEVVLYSEVLTERRTSPLAAGLVHLSIAFSALLLLLALLGVVLGAALEAPARAESTGRLRSLGLGQHELRRVLAGELVAPVLLGATAGLGLGIGSAFATLGPLSLELVTGQSTTPVLVLPWWTLLAVVALVAAALGWSQLEWARLRRASLSTLLRSGERR